MDAHELTRFSSSNTWLLHRKFLRNFLSMCFGSEESALFSIQFLSSFNKYRNKLEDSLIAKVSLSLTMANFDLALVVSVWEWGVMYASKCCAFHVYATCFIRFVFCFGREINLKGMVGRIMPIMIYLVGVFRAYCFHVWWNWMHGICRRVLL